jgi:hypothetical protein
MTPQLVSRNELVRLVNERLGQLPDTGACKLGGVLRLDERDRDGCNWLPSSIRGKYTVEFRQAVTEIQSKYNLQDDGIEAAPPQLVPTKRNFALAYSVTSSGRAIDRKWPKKPSGGPLLFIRLLYQWVAYASRDQVR